MKLNPKLKILEIIKIFSKKLDSNKKVKNMLEMFVVNLILIFLDALIGEIKMESILILLSKDKVNVDHVMPLPPSHH